MKGIFRFFSFLDILSIALLGKQVYSILINFSNIPQQPLSRIKIALLLIIFPLLFVSAYGQFMFKKAGAIVYYIQFPLRLVVWVFSFGFLTLLSQYSGNPGTFDLLFRLVIILEFFRLYYTIRIHRKSL